MSKRKMPANGKASNGSTSLLYDNNNNSMTDHNNNHLGNSNSLLFSNNQDNESCEQLSNNNSPNSFQIKKERYNNDLNDQSSQGNDDLNEDDQLNDLDDNLNNSATSTPTASTTPNNTSNNSTQQLQNQLQQPNKRTLLNNNNNNNSTKLTNGALQSSPLSMCFTGEPSKLLSHLNSLNLTKNDNLLKNNKDGDSLLENLSNLNSLNLSLSSLGNLSSLNLSNLQNLTQLNQLSQLNSLNQLNQFNQLNQQPDNDYDGVLMNANEEDDEDSSNMVITPDIADYASYNDDDLDEQIQTNYKQQQQLSNTMDDDEDLDNDLLNEIPPKDDREGCRSLICDSNGIIIAEMVYRCMICANISDSITDAQRHYQMKHVLHQHMSSLNNFASNNWKSNSANSSRSSNSSLQAQIKNQNFLKKQRQSKLHQMQQLKMQQERIQHLNRIKKEQQKIKEQKTNQQRLIQMHLQQQHQNQLQLQQNQRLEQLRQQKINGLNELAQMQSQAQSNDNNSSPSQLQSNVSNTVADINNLFLNNPPLPGTVAKTPQTAHGSSRGGYVTCAVCSITKFYASVQRRYGQFTCMGCAKFFGRFLAKPKKFNCPNLGSCALNTSPRCKACLLLACINTYTIDEKRKQVVNANRPVQRSGPSGPALIGRASDSAKRKSAAAKLAQQMIQKTSEIASD